MRIRDRGASGNVAVFDGDLRHVDLLAVEEVAGDQAGPAHPDCQEKHRTKTHGEPSPQSTEPAGQALPHDAPAASEGGRGETVADLLSLLTGRSRQFAE